MIEGLRADKGKLSKELTKSNLQMIAAIEMKQSAEEESARLKSLVQGLEFEKRMIQQQNESLTSLAEYVRKTTTQSVYDFVDRLKLDLNLFTEGQQIGS